MCCPGAALLEETGLKVTDIRFLTATNDFMPDDTKHYITLFHVCVRENDDDEPQLLEPDKCESWEWITWNDLLGWIQTSQNKSAENDDLKHKIFIPLLNIAKQRPGVRPTDV
ncbi:putative NUDIX domain [Metarhizium anisopliae]